MGDKVMRFSVFRHEYTSCFGPYYRWLLQNVLPWAIRWFLFGFGFQWIRTVGKPCSAKEAPVIVGAPHTSSFDGYLLCLHGVPSCVAKQDLKNIPLVGSEYMSMSTCRYMYENCKIMKWPNRIARQWFPNINCCQNRFCSSTFQPLEAFLKIVFIKASSSQNVD